MPTYHQTGWRAAQPKGHVLIAIPTYGDIVANCVHSLISTTADLMGNGWAGDVLIKTGDCHVDDARNDLLRLFLESEAGFLFFVDADVSFSPQAVRSLLEANRPIACGVYPRKNDADTYPVVALEGAEPDGDGLIEVKAAPTGFMCIRRDVAEAMYERAGERGAWPAKASMGRLAMREVFYRGISDGQRRSGDYQFCHDAREAGFPIFVRPNLRFGHTGSQTWSGTLQRHWLERSGELEDIAVGAFRRIMYPGADKPRLADFDAMSKAFDNEPFSIDPTSLFHLWTLTRELGPKCNVLETGSGLSTAAFLAATGGDIVSLESEPIWGAKLERMLSKATGYPQSVQYAPIVKHPFGMWYDWPKEIEDMTFDLVLVDGPRRDEFGMRARIVDALPDVLKKARVIVVDDADDKDGAATVKRIRDLLGDCEVTLFDNARGRTYAVLKNRAALPQAQEAAE